MLGCRSCCENSDRLLLAESRHIDIATTLLVDKEQAIIPD